MPVLSSVTMKQSCIPRGRLIANGKPPWRVVTCHRAPIGRLPSLGSEGALAMMLGLEVERLPWTGIRLGGYALST